MLIENSTIYPHLRFSKSDNRGLEFGVIVIKATLSFDELGDCIVSDDQERINVEELTFGKPDHSSLKQPSDLVGFKPSSDVIINAVAYAPNNQPAESWEISVELLDNAGLKLVKKLRVTGPRFWVPVWKRELSEKEKINWRDYRDLFVKWELSAPIPIVKLPIQYEYAYGGTIVKATGDNEALVEEAYQYNPVGIGYIDRDWTDHTKSVPAPQIEDIDDPILDPYKRYKPAGLGAIQRAWLPRRLLGGTFDQNWIDHIWPKWPADYDFAYNNAAAQGLSGNGFLELPICITLINMNKTHSNWVLKIDPPRVQAYYQNNKENFYSIPYLDSLQLNLYEEDDFYNNIFIVWRLIFNLDETEEVTIDYENEQIKNQIIHNPHPEECGIYSDALERPDEQ